MKGRVKKAFGILMAIVVILTTINLAGFVEEAHAAIQTDGSGREYISSGYGLWATIYYLDNTPQNITPYITDIDPDEVDASGEFSLEIIFENIQRDALLWSQQVGMWSTNYIRTKWYFDISSLYMDAETTGFVYDNKNTIIGSFSVAENVVTISWDQEDFLWEITQGGVEYGCFELCGTYAGEESEGDEGVQIKINEKVMTTLYPNGLGTHEHSWVYGIKTTNTDNDTLVAYCNGKKCDLEYTSLETGLTLTIRAPKMIEEGKTVSIQYGTEAEQTAWLNAGLTLPTSFVVKKDRETVENKNLQVGNYTVEVSIGSGEDTVTAISSFDVHRHLWVYVTKTTNTDNDTLVAYCNDAECQFTYTSLETGLTLTIKAPKKIEEGKTVSIQYGTIAEKTAWLNAGLTLPTSFVVKKDGVTVENKNLQVGNYTVEVSIGSGENTVMATAAFLVLKKEINKAFLTKEDFYNPDFNNLYNLNGGIVQQVKYVFDDNKTWYIAGMNDDGTLKLVNSSDESSMNLDMSNVLFASAAESQNVNATINNDLLEFRYDGCDMVKGLFKWNSEEIICETATTEDSPESNTQLFVQWKDEDTDYLYCIPIVGWNKWSGSISATTIGGEGFKLNSDCKIWIEKKYDNYIYAKMVEHTHFDDDNDYLCDVCGEHIIEKGNISDNSTYTLDKYTGKLTISGTQAVKWYSLFSSSELIRTVEFENGITTINEVFLNNCTNLVSVSIPSSVTFIGYGIFNGCTNLSYVFYAGTSEQWNQSGFDSSIKINPDPGDKPTVITSDSVDGASLALDGTLKVNIKLLNADVAGWTINGVTATVDEDNYASIDVAPKDYENSIVIAYGESAGGSVVKTFSVADMLEKYKEDEATRTIAEALEDYCKAAKAYFAGETVEGDASCDAVKEAIGARTLEMGDNYYGSSLVLESGTILRHYYKAEFEGYTGQKGKYYYVDQMIPAHLYANENAYCVNDYIYRALSNNKSTENLKNLCVALYNYGQAAVEYYNATNTAE